MNRRSLTRYVFFALVPTVVALGLVLAACGGGTPEQTPPPPATQEQEAPPPEDTEPPPTEEAPTPADTEEPDPPTPEEPALDGQALLEERCTECHGLDRTVGTTKTEDGWRQTVQRMVNQGANLTPEEQEAVVQYLAATYGE